MFMKAEGKELVCTFRLGALQLVGGVGQRCRNRDAPGPDYINRWLRQEIINTKRRALMGNRCYGLHAVFPDGGSFASFP